MAVAPVPTVDSQCFCQVRRRHRQVDRQDFRQATRAAEQRQPTAPHTGGKRTAARTRLLRRICRLRHHKQTQLQEGEGGISCQLWRAAHHRHPHLQQLSTCCHAAHRLYKSRGKGEAGRPIRRNNTRSRTHTSVQPLAQQRFLLLSAGLRHLSCRHHCHSGQGADATAICRLTARARGTEVVCGKSETRTAQVGHRSVARLHRASPLHHII